MSLLNPPLRRSSLTPQWRVRRSTTGHHTHKCCWSFRYPFGTDVWNGPSLTQHAAWARCPCVTQYLSLHTCLGPEGMSSPCHPPRVSVSWSRGPQSSALSGTPDGWPVPSPCEAWHACLRARRTQPFPDDILPWATWRSCNAKGGCTHTGHTACEEGDGECSPIRNPRGRPRLMRCLW